MSEFVVQLDGRAATEAELGPLAFAGYAHFTAMQVRGGGVRGLDLHLERLRDASEEMFGRAVPDERVRADVRAALRAGPDEVSLTVTVFGSAGEFTAERRGVARQDRPPRQRPAVQPGRVPAHVSSPVA